MSIRRMMLFTLGGFFKSIISLFKTRVLSSGGNFEAETNLENQLNTLGSDLFNSASLVITPNAYKENVLFAVKPDKVGTNLLQQSETFDNSYWSKSLGTITANDAIAPNGTMTADLFTKTSAVNTVSTVWQTTVTKFLSTGIHTLSVYIKPKTGNVVLLRMDGSGNTANALFNFTTKTFTNTGVNIISSTYQELPNGWFRLSLTANVTNIAWTVDVCNLFDNPTGDAMWIWGAQLESGTTATDYISTTDRAIINGTIGDLTVTRATTATRVNEQGLVELVPYNLLSYSEDFSNSYWVKNNFTVTSNSGISPIGTMTASTVIPTSNSSTQVRNTTVFGIGGETYIWSCYIKSNGLRYVTLTAWNNDDPVTVFDLQNGTVVSQSGPPSTAKITNVGNGWCLCEVSRVLRKDSLGIWLRISTTPLNGSNINGSNGYLIWGAQVVKGTEPKPYQLTTNRLNVPRIDYTTGQPAILVEPQRTNLVTYSEDFSNATWTKIKTTINSNAVVAPDGNLSAGGIYPNNGVNINYPSVGLYTSGNVSYLSKSTGTLAPGTYTFSFFIKKNNLRYIQPRVSAVESLTSSVLSNNILDLENKTIYYNDGVSTVKIKDYSNGFVRYEITFNVSTSATYYLGFWYWKETSGITDGTLGYNIWGAQLEAGANATSYIPTVNGSVTRNADVISNTNAYNLIGQTEGTIFIDYNKVLANDTARNIISLSDASVQNAIEIWDGVGSGNLGRIIYTYFANNIIKVSGIGQQTISPSGRYKICLTYLITPSLVNFKIFINGVKLDDRNLTYDAFSSPLTRINIGNRNGTNVGLGSHNLDFILKTRITDAQAIQLTTL